MEFKKILKTNGRVVMVWPVFQRHPLSLRGNAFSPGLDPGNLTNADMAGVINPDITGFKIVNPIPANLQKNIFINLTARRTMVYGREQQKVWREIVVLEK